MNPPSPMMEQYLGFKKSLPPDVLLFFRLGDFYEAFFEDAKTIAPLLAVTLTKRREVPMCGIPYHMLHRATEHLVKQGFRVAIAEIASQPKPGELAKRVLTTHQS